MCSDFFKEGAIKGVMHSFWYPCIDISDFYRELINKKMITIGELYNINKEATREFLTKGVYRFYTLLKGTDAFIKGLSKFYSGTQKLTKAKGTEVAKGVYKIELTDCVDFNYEMYICTIAGLEGALEVFGKHNVRHEIVSGGQDGDEHITIIYQFCE